MIKITKGPYEKNGIELVEIVVSGFKVDVEVTAFKDGDVWRNLENGRVLNTGDIDFALEFKAEAKKEAEIARKAREALNNEQ